jgi:LPS sulfotransferase NodH
MTIVRVTLVLIGTAAYLGLAMLGGGGWTAFCAHPARVALAVALVGLAGVAGRPEEYFWRDNEPRYRAQWHVITYHDYLERALEEGTTPNGIFGAKVGAGVYLAHFFHQLRTLPQFADATLSPCAILSALFPDLKCLWLTRRNKVRQAVSWWKAVQSNVWV